VAAGLDPPVSSAAPPPSLALDPHATRAAQPVNASNFRSSMAILLARASHARGHGAAHPPARKSCWIEIRRR
jgi:hypothetical protein